MDLLRAFARLSASGLAVPVLLSGDECVDDRPKGSFGDGGADRIFCR